MLKEPCFRPAPTAVKDNLTSFHIPFAINKQSSEIVSGSNMLNRIENVLIHVKRHVEDVLVK